MFIYSIVRFIPFAASGEQVNVGLLVGNDETGFVAEWRPNRAALAFGIDCIDGLGKWAEALPKPMTAMKLIEASERSGYPFKITAPKYTIIDPFDGALKTLIENYLPDHKDIQERYKAFMQASKFW